MLPPFASGDFRFPWSAASVCDHGSWFVLDMHFADKGTHMSFPSRLFLGKMLRAFRAGIGSADEIRTPQDLPSRLLLGQLVENSFLADAAGWRAIYEGRQAQLALQWDGERLCASQRWFAHTALTNVGLPRIVDIARAALVHHEWLGVLPAALHPPLNVFVETGAATGATMVCYPDGLLLTLLVPVPVRRLETCAALIRDLEEAPDLLASVSSELRCGWSVVNHIAGRSVVADLPHSAIDELTYREMGLPTFEPAQTETRRDGSSAVTVRRRHYELVVNLFFCDLPLVLAKFNEHGLLAVRTTVGTTIRDEWPFAPEYSAVVLPAIFGPRVQQLVFFDEARTRRVVYPGPIRAIDTDSNSVEAQQIRGVQELVSDALGNGGMQ